MMKHFFVDQISQSYGLRVLGKGESLVKSPIQYDLVFNFVIFLLETGYCLPQTGLLSDSFCLLWSPASSKSIGNVHL